MSNHNTTIMKTHVNKFRLLLILLLIPMTLSDCKKQEEALRDFAVIDVRELTDWDYWIAAKDGSNFFVQEDNLKPIVAYYQPDINQEGYPIFFDENGLPSKAVINDHIVIYKNFRENLADIAVIDPSGEITIYRDLQANIDLSVFGLKSANIDMDFERFLHVTDLSIGVASCLIALVPSGPIQVVGAMGCAATILELIAEAEPENLELLGISGARLGEIADALGCIGGADLTDCYELFATTAIRVTEAAIGVYDTEKNKTEIAEGLLTGKLIKDVDNNYYLTKQIGAQTWMAENLKTTKFNDGTAIQNITSDVAWNLLSSPAYCWYKNDEATYKNPYGAMYNWYAVNTGKLCPSGWHVPSDAEWHTLALTIDPTATLASTESLLGGKLKETGTSHWGSPNTGATNESGFSAVAAGNREDNIPGGYDSSTNFEALMIGACFWTSTEYNTTIAWYRNLGYNTPALSRLNGNNQSKKYGYSVRCIKD